MKIIIHKYFAKTTVVFLSLFLSITTIAQEKPEILVKLDSSEILIGDQIKLNIELKYQKNLKVAFPDISNFFPEKIEIIEQKETDTIIRDIQISEIKI
ncbi:MAG: hypothetical protein PF487_13740 [Bacteroidales bacterium]|jgi:predicted protein tyrosine phosphatase|nr:hypothetical protein [Bacteroidales bacterium]